MSATVNRDGERIQVQGDLDNQSLHIFLAAMHAATEKAGYADLLLDFRDCTAAFPGVMVAAVAQITSLREADIYCRLTLPDKQSLRRLFLNANWAHLVDPRQFDPSTFRGYTQVPATQFQTPDQQQSAVNCIVDAILGAVPDLHREDFAAFEWSINELTDNVLTHSASTTGGVVQMSTFQRNRNRVEFVVADAGIGIPGSLRPMHPEWSSDTEALDKAIREGVTRDKSVGQGNGLFGSWRICSQCGGAFLVESGRARLSDSVAHGLHVREQKIPFSGTLAVATIDFTNPTLLQEALKFGGKQHAPIDYVETHFESGDVEELVFVIRDESASLGSRPAGTPVRQKLENLSKMGEGRKVIIDFAGIGIISSSFADEVIGKLFVSLGPMAFMAKFELRNMSSMVKQLIDRAIQQRMGN